MSDVTKQQDTRRAFVDTLNDLAVTDPNIIVVIPDVGFNYLDDPKNKFKVINTGVNEQFATIFAANLALQGWTVYYYTMINFALFRNAEMVRNAIVCHKAPVTILGVKGSESYRFLGFSHNLLHEKEDTNFCENIGLMWAKPKTNEEVCETILRQHKSPQPLYVRL